MKTKTLQPFSLLDNVNSSAEMAALFDTCSCDANAQKAFVQECIVDSLILIDCKNAPSIKNADSQEEWNRLLNDSLEMKSVQYIFTNKTIPFTKTIRLIAAACVSIAAGGLIFNLLHAPVNKDMYTGNDSKDVSLTNSSNSVPARETSRNDIVTSDSQNSIVMFDRKTAGVIGNKSHMTVEKKDTAVYLSLTSGAVLFTVEKGRYRSFTVVTPHAKIKVTGTTFRVDAMERMTRVIVVEGSVKVIHDMGIDHDTVSLTDGNVAVADSVSIREFESEIEQELSFPVRNFLDDFVKNSYTGENGDGTPVSELQADALLLKVTKKSASGLNMYDIFSAANTLKTAKRYEDAMLLYEYVLDNSDVSELQENAACYLTWSLIQKKTDTFKRSADIYMHAAKSSGDERINLIRLFPDAPTQP